MSIAKSETFNEALATVYSAAKAKAAPGAKVVATSYPRPFNGTDCSVLTSFTTTEMTKLNEGADILAASIAVAATVTTGGQTSSDTNRGTVKVPKS